MGASFCVAEGGLMFGAMLLLPCVHVSAQLFARKRGRERGALQEASGKRPDEICVGRPPRPVGELTNGRQS